MFRHTTNKMLICILLTVIYTCHFDTHASATIEQRSLSQQNNKINISKGRVNGEKLDYILYLPTRWSSYLSAERDTARDLAFVEKITFRYVPQQDNAKPVFFMNFFVCDKRYYKDSGYLTKVLETQEYVFACEAATANSFTNETDKAIFEKLLQDSTDIEYLANSIKMSSDQKVVYKNTITVNGKKLKAKSYVKEDGGVHVPIRDVCEALGYKVGWLEKEKVITLAKQDFYKILFPGTNEANKGYHVLVLKGRSYIRTVFFLADLKANVEIDENYNVLINK